MDGNGVVFRLFGGGGSAVLTVPSAIVSVGRNSKSDEESRGRSIKSALSGFGSLASDSISSAIDFCFACSGY